MKGDTVKNRYQEIAEALIALAKCVPDSGTISVQAKYGSIDFHIRTDEQAAEIAEAFSIKLETTADDEAYWLAGSAVGAEGTRVAVYGPTHRIERTGEPKPLDEVQVDAALAAAAEVARPAPGPVSDAGGGS